MIALMVYAAALVIVILHFTKFWSNRNMEWIVLVAPVIVFAVNILDYLKILSASVVCPPDPVCQDQG